MSNDEVIAESENVPTEDDYNDIAYRLKTGHVVPFFGAGASLSCGDLPSGQELAKRIATAAKFPDPDEQGNLALVASYLVQIGSDSVALETLLRQVFNVDTQPSLLHHCIASVDGLKLVVTTNYDDLIERALEAAWTAANSEARKPWIVVDRGIPGKVWYRQPGTRSASVKANNLRYKLTNPETAPGQQLIYRPILFKMHGSLDREDQAQDWFLITEEHYVDFLGRQESAQTPALIKVIMDASNFLFLGYGLRDWNIRVMLRKIMMNRGLQSRKVKSWAVVKKASTAEKRLWMAHGVRIFEVELDTFAQELQARL
jgi:hypothetical protein